MKRLAGAALLLLTALGRDRMVVPAPSQVYAPWEDGLTLGYENPSLAPEQRLQERLQVRVKRTAFTGTGRLVVETFTTLSGAMEATFSHSRGGVTLGADPARGVRILPEGFPDQVSRWEDRGTFHWVVGRAQVTLPGLKLPERTGVWVETLPVGKEGLRQRTLLVPDVGEVETLIWREGAWVPVARLVSRGFTDLK